MPMDEWINELIEIESVLKQHDVITMNGEKIYKVICVRKPNKPSKNGLRVIRCDCERLVTISKECEIQRHLLRSPLRGFCKMTWKRVRVSDDGETKCGN